MLRSKSELSNRLSELEDFSNPKPGLEQYSTPPDLAATLLHTASLHQDLQGKRVADLGAGTGILGFGASLLGARTVFVEKDPELEDRLNRLSKKATNSEVLIQDVSEFSRKVDTVVSNPPFGVHSDEWRKFLQKGFRLSNRSYWIILSKGFQSFRKEVESSRHSITDTATQRIGLPASMGFHTESIKNVQVKLVITEASENEDC